MTGLAHRIATSLARGALVLLGLAISCAQTFAAEVKWSPTVVSTVAGAMPDAPPPPGKPVRAKLPQWADPKFTPKQIYTRQGGSLPEGAWSPIVTGAVPEGDGHGEDHAAAPAQAAPAGEPAHAGAGEAKSEAPAGANVDGRPPREKPLQGLPPDATPAQQYCFNTADSAADARFAWQQQKIKEMETELEKRAQVLQERTEEYKTWLARRDEFSRKAQDKLVAFYAKMKPDAAAQQIAAMDEDIAAALLMKLEPKVASLFLAEIEPTKAAKLAALISGLSKVAASKKQKAANAGVPPAGAPGAQPGGGAQRAPGEAQPQAAGAPRS